MQYNNLCISYDIYVALVSLVASLGPCNIDLIVHVYIYMYVHKNFAVVD